MGAAVALAVVVWLLFLRDGDDEPSTKPSGDGTQAEKTVEVVTAAELPGAVTGAGYPVYWIGPRPGVQYELTSIADGRTFIRYLPESEEPETKTPYLTVGTYQQDNASQVIEDLATESGARTFEVPGGGIGYEAQSGTSVYVAFPGDDSQVEVYDPARGEARKLVESGVVIPVS